MLTHIAIRNFAIIHHLELDLTAGMTALTGETGAGKSILVGALGLALGERADASAVRQGSAQAEVSAVFQIDTLPRVQAWLTERGLDTGGECIIRRTVSAGGRSRAYINARPVPVQTLQALGSELVDSHGQHAHHSLLRREVQRQLLDGYGGHDALVAELSHCFHRWRELRDQQAALRTEAEDRRTRRELLRYQCEELAALALHPDELEALDREHQRLRHAHRLLESAQEAVAALYEDDDRATLKQLDRIARDLDRLTGLDPRLASPVTLLREAAIQLEEATGELRHYLSSLELDPNRLQHVEERLDALHDLARKHRVEPAELAALHTRLGEELTRIETADARLDEFHRALEEAEAQYFTLAARLSKSRRTAARALSRQVTENMQKLGMPGGRFEVTLEPVAKHEPRATGQEQIAFMVSTNPGAAPRPLAKVASGGELSRISLAIQVIAAQNLTTPTLVFDEVDVGIGGSVAEIVGRQLRALSASRQVLCITHLPQVAAQAGHHLRVSKTREGGQSVTVIEALSDSQRREEIARMLGGVKITPHTRAHAREMLNQAVEEK
ncbi:MAG TPA: DNA repair protein RecN [Gammaproteobacteria bacterium]|nr:DNA repair protein RecN [Gammaproteobacteria bacterium]